MMTNTQHERAQEIEEAFDLFEDWEDRYSFLIDLGRKLPPMPEADKTEENRVHGCQSKVWVTAHPRAEAGGRVMDFVVDSDSTLVKGLVAVLWSVFSGQKPSDILTYDIEGLLRRLNLEEHLTLNRRNGLYGMVKKMRALAAMENQA